MTRMLPVAAALLIALGLLAPWPSTTAHIQNFSDARSIRAAPYSATLQPAPAPLYAGATANLSIYLFHDRRGTVEDGVNVSVGILSPTGQEVANLSASYELRSLAFRTPDLVFPTAGNYTATLRVTDAEGDHGGQAVFEVFPELGFRIVAGAPEIDVVEDRTATLEFRVETPDGGGAAPGVSDLRVRAEHWSDDHQTFHSSHGFEFRPGDAPGTWVARHAFPEPGMWHLWFASDSGGLDFFQAPMMHVYAVDGAGPERAAPAASAVLLVIGAVLVLRIVSRLERGES